MLTAFSGTERLCRRTWAGTRPSHRPRLPQPAAVSENLVKLQKPGLLEKKGENPGLNLDHLRATDVMPKPVRER